MRVHIIPAIELAELRKLNFVRRLVSHRGLRHTAGVLLGSVIILIGTALAKNGAEVFGGNHTVWDAFGYSVHGFGLVPILKHIEAFWDVLLP